MEIQQIAPAKTDRAILYGWTGCGKTTLAEFLLNLRADVPVWVFDWKGLIRWHGYKRFSKLNRFLSANPFRGIYQPSIHENDSEDYWNAFFHACWLKGVRNPGGLQVYVDEVYCVTKKDIIPRYYRALIAQGRQHGISLYSATQRPMDIPQVVMSEAENSYVFKLHMPQDRKKVEQMTTISVQAQETLSLKKHQFFYANAEGDVSPRLHLTIKKRTQ